MKQHSILRASRRAVLAGIAAGLAPGLHAAWAQPRDSMHRLGVLATGLEGDPLVKQETAGLMHGLGALGWKDSTSLHIEWRWGGTDSALMERQAAELAALGPEVLLAGGNILTLSEVKDG